MSASGEGGARSGGKSSTSAEPEEAAGARIEGGATNEAPAKTGADSGGNAAKAAPSPGSAGTINGVANGAPAAGSAGTGGGANGTPDAAGDGTAASGTAGNGSVASGTAASDTAGNGPGASGSAANGPAATGTAANGPAANGTAANGAAAAAGVAAAGGGADGKPRHLRRASPLQAVKRAGQSTSAWAKRPSGRLILPAIVAVLLLGAAGTAGAYLVPQALQAPASPSATPAFPLDASGAPLPPPSASLPVGAVPSGPGLPVQSGLPTTGGTTQNTQNTQNTQTNQPAQPTATGGRPADVLAGWAQQVGTRSGIPVVAVQAYGYAELVLARTMPSCHLSWTTLAAIGKVESAHGSYKNSVLGADGTVQPPIYGLPLDGKGGRQLIRDTDQGTLDQDPTYDRAIGPLQFIPATWLAYKVDADNNGAADPNDIDDAALTAATYLCQGGRDMSKPDSWWDAILSYNAVRPYAQKVFDAANEYGQLSRG